MGEIEWIEGPPPASASPNPHYFEPGTLLHLNTGEIVLVGHINDVGGECDHCSSYITRERVLAHAFFWVPLSI